MAEEGKVEALKERTDYRSVPSCGDSASSSDDEEGEGFGDLKNWAGRAKSGTEADEDSETEFNQILELCRLKREAAKEHAEKGVKARTDDKRPPPRGGGATRRVFDDEYYTLPPAEDPAIHVQEDIELKRFGVVHRLIDFIVNIKPDSGVPHLGYDTMLFDGERNAVGPIFEVFGPVCDTMYALRFNSAEEASLRLPIGMAVFYAPDGEGVFTKVILTDELKRMKISDSAGKAHEDDAGSVAGSNGSDGDDEPAFSDDEQERLYHERRRMRKTQRMRNDQRQRDPSISSLTGQRAVPSKRPRGAHPTAMARGVAGFQRFSRPPPPSRSSYPRNQAPHFAMGAPPMGMPPAPLSGVGVGFVDYSRPPPPFHHQVLYQAPPPPPPPPRQWTTTGGGVAATTMGMTRPGYSYSSAHRGGVGRGGGGGRGRQ